MKAVSKGSGKDDEAVQMLVRAGDLTDQMLVRTETERI
jgi:hypothetical protein